MQSEELTETTPVAPVPLPATTFSCKQHREQAEKFYRDLAAQGMKIRAGMEASGHARWFERLVAELRFELWIGDAAEIRTMRVRIPNFGCAYLLSHQRPY